MSILNVILLFLFHPGFTFQQCSRMNAASHLINDNRNEGIHNKMVCKSNIGTKPMSEESIKWQSERLSNITNTGAVVQLVFVFDSTLQERFKKDSLQFRNIVRWLVNEMNTVFFKSSLSNPTLRIQLTDFVTGDMMIDKDFRLVNTRNRLRRSRRTIDCVDGHAMLHSYTSKLNANRTGFATDFDHCIIFTSLDIWKLNGDGVHSDIVGCTYQSSTCTHERFSLVEYSVDLRLLLRTCLHELGHGLGGFHDGDSNIPSGGSSSDCLPRDGFIMGLPIRSPTTNFFKFSNCSLADVSSYLRSRRASCLYVG